MSNLTTAKAFFELCETGRGWEACRAHCTPDASFAAQAGALAEIRTLAQYADWMQGILTVLTDGRYELHAFAEDAERGEVVAFATFIGTHKAGGPMPPTGRTTRTDYVYAMRMRDGRIAHMTKVWNDGYALQELGWA
ncbi:ester cyclase [Paracraurococcus ruber]|uniref:Polyketide cyclase n=1 Tax=Paracraurococcus ruber TaxID=77675 RepID=A0ABS1D610_9PROT|nr:nuclear transport factor 2 family protein [Paracraurococcus ruber]MBK1662322.1 polyketide cyclase [Paracraurococcus ruber]TDG17519.1 nuclear transport factor 2 family protein [Paracraurococcus ruber]